MSNSRPPNEILEYQCLGSPQWIHAYVDGEFHSWKHDGMGLWVRQSEFEKRVVAEHKEGMLL